MNTNDFYKELFEKYALDEDKIRRNAIKAAKTPAWQRTLGTHWKSVVGAAAAVAVTTAGVAYISGISGNDGITISSSDTILSAAERLAAAERNYSDISAEETAISNIYVTFKEPVCYSDMAVSLSALADYDNIEVARIYLTDGTVYSSMTDISGFAETRASDKCIAGAKLSAPSGSFRDIFDLSCVDVAELESDDINDATFAPLVRDDTDKDADPLSNDSYTVTSSAPAVTTAPFSFEVGTAATTAAPVTAVTTTVPEDTEAVEPDITTADPELNDPEITGSDGVVVEIDDDIESITTAVELDDPLLTSETSDTTAETTTEIAVSTTEITEAPSIGLMTRIYQLNAPNALDTVLVGDNVIVLAREQVYFFRLGGMLSESPARVINIASPKIAYSDSNSVVVTGCGKDGLRNKIVVLNTVTGVLYGADNDDGADLGTSEIGRVYYSEAESKYFVSTIAGSTTYFYEVTVDPANGIQFRALVEFAGPVAAAGYRNGTLWFTGAADNVNYSLWSFDCVNGVLAEDAKIGTGCKVRRSLTFGSFLLTAADENGVSHTYAFDISSGLIIPVDVPSDALVAEKNGTIYINADGKTYYVSSDGVLTETNVYAAFTRKVTSSYAIMSQDSEKIVVAETNPNIW